MKIYDKIYVLRIGVPNYSLKEISDWDVDEALSILANIEDAYAFRFQRRGWEEERLPGQYNIKASIIKESGTYYLDAYTETLDDVRARIDLNHDKDRSAKDKALVQLMETNGQTTIVKSINDKWSSFFNEETDVILDVSLTKGEANGKRDTKVQDQEE